MKQDNPSLKPSTNINLLSKFSKRWHSYPWVLIKQNQKGLPDLFLPVNLLSGLTSFPCFLRLSFFSRIQSRLFFNGFPRLFFILSRVFSYWIWLFPSRVSVPNAFGNCWFPPIDSRPFLNVHISLSCNYICLGK